ncbi:MAG: hypothetical protein ACTSQJ_07650 [Promethearchaeota archaeon]
MNFGFFYDVKIIKMNRHYVGIDSRMLSILFCKDFILKEHHSINIFSIGVYQPNLIEESSEDGYRKFILKLISAKTWSVSTIFQGIYKDSLKLLYNSKNFTE